MASIDEKLDKEQAIGDRLWTYAQDEIADARLLVEKVVALGGSPSTDVGELRWNGAAEDARSPG